MREHGQQLDLGALAARVGGRRGVLALGVLRVVGAQLLAVHPAGGHQQHPRVVPAERRSQQLGHQQRPEHVQRHGQLVALGRLGARWRHRAGVVHEHVEPVEVELAGEAAYVVEVGDVAAVDGDRRAGHLGLELGLDPGTLLHVAYDEAHVGAEPGEPLGRGEPEPGGRAGDGGGPAGHAIRAPGRRASRAAGGARQGRSW